MATVAIIDDSPAIIEMLTQILRGASHNVISYLDPTAVEDKISETLPDMVLLDIVMPSRNGYEILRALKRNASTKTIPVIVVSSKGEETDVRWGKRQGAVDYIVKPFTPDTILSTIQAHL